VGIDPLSPEWTMLFRKLNIFGGDVFGIDHKNFDGSLDPDVMMKVCEDINRWYDAYGNGMTFDFYGKVYHFTPREANIARILLVESMIHTYQIVENVLHQKHQGEPSGVALTVIMNGEGNDYYVRVGYELILASEIAKNPMLVNRALAFASMVRLIVYGDDAVIAPHKAIQSFFNYKTFAYIMAKYDLQCTPADKKESFTELVPLTDVTFLKRRFMPDVNYPDLIRAPLDVSTTFEMLNWVRKCDDVVAACKVNCDCALREIIHMDSGVCKRLLERINEELGEIDEPPVVFSIKGENARWLGQFF
jgi:hypothetical protein